VALSGRVERARLSDSINDMLDRLEKTQEALEISESKYRSLFLNTATAMLVVNTETSLIELVNAEFERLSGYPRGEVEHRKSWKEFTRDFDAQAIEDFFRRRAAADGQFPGTIDCRFIGRAREILFVSLTVAMIKGTDSCIVSMIDLRPQAGREALASSIGHWSAGGRTDRRIAENPMSWKRPTALLELDRLNPPSALRVALKCEPPRPPSGGCQTHFMTCRG
jgi:PAS domain S-box-containing protein